MGKKTGENSKKVAGQARKAEAAAAKKAQEEAQREHAEEEEWKEGSKKANAKKLAEQEKKARAAQLKKEKEEALAEEEASVKTNKQSKQERNKFKKGNLDDFLSGGGKSELNASGIDDALDALELATGSDKNANLDRHPERRYKAAYAAYEARRMPEVKQEYSGLRQNQMKQLIHKEFEKSPENPFNQVSVSYNASREEQAETKAKLREARENRLTQNR